MKLSFTPGFHADGNDIAGTRQQKRSSRPAIKLAMTAMTASREDFQLRNGKMRERISCPYDDGSLSEI
jgi:hypothetical protein